MSEIRVDRIVNASGSGAVEFSQGISLPTGQTLSGIAQTAESLTATANINTTGIITATSFSGDGSNLTGVGVTVDTRTNSLVVSGVSTFSDVNISGNLTVDGTTTTISSVNLVVEDKNIGIGTTTTPSNTTADGGGLTLFGGGDGDKTLTWVNSTAAWTSNQDLNLASGKVYEINGSTVLSSSQVLGKSVPSGTIVGDTDSQTLSSKTLCSSTLTGSLTAGGGTGSNGQFLQSTGSGVQWGFVTPSAIAVCCVSNFLSCNTCAPNISSGANNFFVGSNAGRSITSGSNNFFVGSSAGCCVTTNSNNIFIGASAGLTATAGDSIFLGNSAGSGSTGSDNIAIGCKSSQTNGGIRNIALGSYALNCNQGWWNIALGERSLGGAGGSIDTNSRCNIAIGYYAGKLSRLGSRNIFLGANAGCNATGSENIFIGSFTGTGFTACTNHIFLSDGAGNNRLQLNNCGALGLAGANYGTAGQVLTSCGNAAAPVWVTSSGGAIAGCCVSNFLSCNTCAPNISGTSGNNFLVGCNAGLCLTTGTSNNFFGNNAGQFNSTGSHNNFLGFCAGRFTTGSYNTFIGVFAGQYNTTGCNNTFFGQSAGRYNTTGCNNTFIGCSAGRSNTTGSSNFFAGCCAGRNNTTGCHNTFIGQSAGQSNITASNNTFFGCNSGCSITGGCNVVIGSFTGTGFTACTNHIFLSDGAGNNRLQLNNCGALGLAGANYGTAGQVLTSCGNAAAPVWVTSSGGAIAGCCVSNFLSCNTCAPNISGTSGNNFLVGCNAGLSLTFGCNNFLVGLCAGTRTTTGGHNNFLGCCAGSCNTFGSHNNFFGRCAGSYNTTGDNNNLFGRYAGSSNTTGCHNDFFGNYAGCSNTTGCHNTFIGQNAGRLNTTGSNNTFFGQSAGRCNTTGCNNIAIGQNSGNDALYNFNTSGGSNIIVIGNNNHTASYVKVDWTTGSDARDKTNIIPIPVGKEFLKQLNPVQYQWADRETGEVTAEKPNYGFLAQDIFALENPPQVIVDDHDPEHLKLRQSMIVPILVKTVQELIEEVDALKEEVRILKGE